MKKPTEQNKTYSVNPRKNIKVQVTELLEDKHKSWLLGYLSKLIKKQKVPRKSLFPSTPHSLLRHLSLSFLLQNVLLFNDVSYFSYKMQTSIGIFIIKLY